MSVEVLFVNEYIKISRMNEEFFIEAYQNGMTFQAINSIISKYVQIKISSFNAIKMASTQAPIKPTLFGVMRERIIAEISPDGMEAYITLYMDEKDILDDNRHHLVVEIVQKLREIGVVFGLKNDILQGSLRPGVKTLIAEGIPPIHGEDSHIQMFEMSEPKPEMKEDGNVNHYELNLINMVDVGEWLGERLEPSIGIHGKSVTGEELEPIRGKKLPLLYDTATVMEVHHEFKTVLTSKVKGAVYYKGDRISVSNYLEVKGDVDFKTGNIDFDGFLTVAGTINDNFSVSADRDLEIRGNLGIGSAKEITSRNGSIYIKGGIAGNNKTAIRCTKDIYTKFVANTKIICEGTVFIGLYCLDSEIIAKQVIIDSPKGQIIGGRVQAEYKVETSYIGNSAEKRTVIAVTGFDKKKMKEDYDKMLTNLEKSKIRLTKLKQELSIYTMSHNLSIENQKAQEVVTQNYFTIKDVIKQLEYQIKTTGQYLRIKGEGEINVTRKIYPNTCIQMRNNSMEIKNEYLTICYHLHEGQIVEK